MSNDRIAGLLQEIAIYLEMEDIPFRPRAYEKAGEGVLSLDKDVKEIYKEGGLPALEKIPNVGKSIAEKIEEFIKTGKIKDHEVLKKKIPVNLGELRMVEGIGPKKIKILYQKLKIKNLKDLASAVKAGKIRKLEGFGEKSEENIFKGLEFIKKAGGRFVLGFVDGQIEEIRNQLEKIKGASKAVVAGSIRRRKDNIGDADILVIIDEKRPVFAEAIAGKIMDYFVSMPEVARVFAHGNTKSAIKLSNGLDVDLRVVPKESYGAALNYFTGSKDHNVALREMAIKKGWKLNEYGLFKVKKGKVKSEKFIAGRTEEELYKALGLEYIEPELREMTGELDMALQQAQGKLGGLPDLIGYNDLRGDLQVQTNWTDGAHSIEEMAREAAAVGLEYIVITDHTKRLAMTRGLDEKRIQKQWAEIDEVNRKLKVESIKFKVLKGTECDILKDGSMDLPDEILSKCDVVGASVHSLFNLPKKEQTARIMKAMSNPHVDILFHPTGRVLNKRDAYELDIDAIINHAKKTKTVLEIDAFPDRADLKAEYIRKCVEAGVKMSIDSDAHHFSHFQYLKYGIAQARRGWAKRSDIINSYSVEDMLKLLKKNHKKR